MSTQAIPLAVVITVAGAAVALIAIVIGLTVIVASGHNPSAVETLFQAVVTGIFTVLAAVVSHTLGFRNGTTNGEAQAQAQALRSVMGQQNGGSH